MSNNNSNNKTATVKDLYPNASEIKETASRQMDENNYFNDHSKELLREKYIKFTVLMDFINQTLELDPSTTIEQFSIRVSNLITASKSL